MKNIISFIIITTSIIFCAEFVVISFEKDANDKSATNEDTKLLDVNGNECAMIKVMTDLTDLSFESTLLEKSKLVQEGEYWVYLQRNTKRLKFNKEGVIPFTYEFPDKLVESTVYILKLTAEGLQSKIEDITINLIGTPENSIITLDGEEKGKIKSLKTFVGKHELKVTKDGYQTYTKEIDVSPDKTMFEFKLEKVQDAFIEINSNPSGATVFINEIELGTTPLSSFHPVGSFKLKLSSNNIEDIEETIEINAPETKKTYQLEDLRATLTINTDEKAKVYINGEQVTDFKNLKLTPKQYVIKVEMNKAKTLEESVLLGEKDNKVLDMYPQIETGTVQISVTPSDAEIKLYEEGGEKYTNTGTKSFSNIPIGTYRLRVYKKGFKSEIQEVRLTAGAIETKSIKLEEGEDYNGDYIFVEGGTFQMGCSNGNNDEVPVHSVTLSDFIIGKTEVTQAQYQAVMGKNPSTYKGSNNPVETVNWEDAVEFCNKLSAKEGLTKCYSGSDESITCNFNANGYRLPTEAEWEYAARGGNQSKGYEYSGSNSIESVGWCMSNSDSTTHPVGQKQPNELGIYDMSGNVWEWCWDWYDKDYYKSSPSKNPTGPSSGSNRILRGGCWLRVKRCRVFYRSDLVPYKRYDDDGFRIVRVL